MFDILKIRQNSLDEYDFKDRLRELGHFLKIGKDNTLTLYHLSLTEWLTSEENEKYFVSKKKGHEAFCDYYFGAVRDRKKNRPKNYLSGFSHLSHCSIPWCSVVEKGPMFKKYSVCLRSITVYHQQKIR